MKPKRLMVIPAGKSGKTGKLPGFDLTLLPNRATIKRSLTLVNGKKEPICKHKHKHKHS